MKTFLFFICSVISLTSFASEFTYEDLVAIAKDKQSLEEVLPLVPASLRQNYTLMYESRSLQGASYTNPRAILFGEEARLVCTFNGDSTQKGHDLLECYQFRDQERAFDFRQIQFPTPQNGLKEVRFSERGKSADGKKSCGSCHSSDSRPNWDGYAEWPGAYGAFDDEVVGDTNYPKFVELRSRHPRYRWLIQEDYAEAPYLGNKKAGHFKFVPSQRPNFRFSDFVGKLNGLRAGRILKSQVPHWRVLAFAISTLKCTLSSDQMAQIQKAGLNFNDDSDIKKILAVGGLSHNDWSTEIFDDEDVVDPDHLSGFGYMLNDMAMSVVQDYAKSGNTVFQNTLNNIVADYSLYYSNEFLDFLTKLSTIIVELDESGEKVGRNTYGKNVPTICGELIRIFMPEYLQSCRL